MAVWQFVDAQGKPLPGIYDDTGQAQPGDPAFSTDAVKAQMATVSGAKNFNYVGTSAPPAED